MNKDKKNNLSDKDKLIKKLEEDIDGLKKSLANTQDQSNTVLEKNKILEVENARLDEKIKGTGLLSTVASIFTLLLGIGFTYTITNDFTNAAKAYLASGIVGVIYILINNFKNK